MDNPTIIINTLHDRIVLFARTFMLTSGELDLFSIIAKSIETAKKNIDILKKNSPNLNIEH